LILLFILAISMAPLQILYYSEALRLQHGHVSEFHAEARARINTRQYVTIAIAIQ